MNWTKVHIIFGWLIHSFQDWTTTIIWAQQCCLRNRSSVPYSHCSIRRTSRTTWKSTIRYYPPEYRKRTTIFGGKRKEGEARTYQIIRDNCFSLLSVEQNLKVNFHERAVISISKSFRKHWRIISNAESLYFNDGAWRGTGHWRI